MKARIIRNQSSRRGFLKSTLAGAMAPLFIPRSILGQPGTLSPNEKPTRAIIGVGGMGRGHIGYIPESPLLAICDVDSNHLKQAKDQIGRDIDAYSDFRELLERPDIDIVHIPTPPHWHACMAVAAAKAGKDIWCEKPMTRTIAEGQKVVEAVQTHNRIFRLNTWFRFQDGFYGYGTTVEPIRKAVMNGLLGWPLKVIVSEHTGFNWKFGWSGRTDLQPQPVPSHLDYQMWLGPAPFKHYHPHRVHGSFRGYWDYDGGGLGDMGQHYLDPIQYILGKDHTSPVHIEADTDPQDIDAVGSWRRIELTYQDGCQIILDGQGIEKDAPFIEGPEGKLFKNLQSNIPGFKQKLDALENPPEQVTDFLQAVVHRRKFALNESNGHRSCTLINLGKIALRTRRRLTFDPNLQIFPNDTEANSYVQQPMREPWNLFS
jgi:myo-inositol 2-dehydrogenase / D-chiro-inositol 1-dehydrogenase